MQDSNSKSTENLKQAPAPLLSPALIDALAELAATENLPVGALVAILINEALDRRLRRSHA